MNVQVPATDEREIEVVAAGLSIHHGAQLAVDITFRSAVTSVGALRTTAATVNGAALTQVRLDKEAKNAGLVRNERCRLVVVALETGGRWGTEALDIVADMASSRARDAPPVLRRSAFLCVAEEVDKDVVSVMRQGVRGFSGRGSARRLGRR